MEFKIGNIKLHSFMINLDASGMDLVYSTTFYANIFCKNTAGKLYIIPFRTVNIDKIKQGIENIDNKKVLVEYLPKCFDTIVEFILRLTKEDSVIIIGGERLVPYGSNESVVNLGIHKKEAKVHLQEEENWQEFANRIDYLYGRVQEKISGLLINCYVDSDTRKVILEKLDFSNNMSIVSNEFVDQSGKEVVLQKRILGEIKILTLKEALDLIEANREELNESICDFLKSMAYLQNGNISKAIVLLKKNYNNLLQEYKIMLADLLTINHEHEQAQKIIQEIYSYDKYQKGLMESGLRAYYSTENYKDWLEIALNIEPNNPIVIENHGDYLVENAEYKLAAMEFRKLSSMLKDPYYELVARVNDLLNENQTDKNIIKSYLFSIIDEHPELKNEAIYRIASLNNLRESYFSAYEIIGEAEITGESPRVFEILDTKLTILGDTIKASRALMKIKPFNKERDANLLRAERSKALLEAIEVFSYKKDGFYRWRHFMECQTVDVWNQGLYLELMKVLSDLAKIDCDSEMKKSYISGLKLREAGEELDCESGIVLFRNVRSGHFSFTEVGANFEEMAKGILTLAEIKGTIKEKLWCRYYVAISASLLVGNPQDANNHSLTLFELQDVVPNEYRKLCIYLGLVAWGNSQYRLGLETEGIVCIIGAYKLAKETGEFAPMLEEGINIIVKFLWDNCELIKESDKKIINDFILKVQSINDSVTLLYSFINKSYKNEIEKLKEMIEKQEHKDANWAGAVSNLIQAYAQSGKFDEAVKTINKYYPIVLKYMDSRKDIRYKTEYVWADILFHGGGTVNDYLLALEFLESAMVDVEEKRNAFHQEERAGVAEFSDRINRKYIQINSLLYGANDIQDDLRNKLKNNILKVAFKMVPLSIIEQKQYNKYKTVTPKLEQLHLELKQLKEEYSIMIKKNRGTDENVINIGKRIIELNNALKEKHPYYMPLTKSNEFEWKDIQEKLGKNDVLYQYICTPMAVTTILVTSNKIDVGVKMIDPKYDDVYECISKFGKSIEETMNDNGKIEELAQVITKLLAEELYNYVSVNSVETIYVIPELRSNMFPIAACCNNGEFLIDKVNAIVNLIDYEEFMKFDSSNKEALRILNRVYGNSNDNDKSIAYITSWLDGKKGDSFINLDNNSDDINNIQKTIDEYKINALAIYGHGAKDPNSNSIEGAQTIVGKNSMIRINKLLDEIRDIKTFILISCVGGSPNSLNPELSTGTWTNMFEKFNGNIIACKWSVPTQGTIELMNRFYDIIITKDLSMGEALIMAQRELKKQGKGIWSWAGVEYWIN